MTAETLKQWRVEIALAITAIALFLSRLGAPALRDYDEALYATVARDIVRTGSWMSLSIDGAYYSHKPPLMFWLMAMSYRLFGINEFAARLPAALFAIAGIAAAYAVARRLYDRRIAQLAALIVLTAPQWLSLGRQAMLDVPLATLLTLAALGVLRRSWLLTGFALGAGFLIKGPLVLLTIASGLVVALIRRGDYGRLAVKATLLAFAIAAPWHLHQILTHGEDFTGYYFGVNVVTRLTRGMEGHGHDWTYYFERVFYRWFNPWHAAGAITLIVMTIRAVRRIDKPWIVLWFWIPFITLTLAGTKLHWYVTPVYVPLAIMTAAWLIETGGARPWVRRVVIVLTILTLLQSALYSFYRGRKSPTEDTRTALRGLPPKEQMPVLAISERTPNQAARFYADRTIGWCTEASPPPAGVWILTTPQRAAGFGKRPVVVITETRVLLGRASP